MIGQSGFKLLILGMALLYGGSVAHQDADPPPKDQARESSGDDQGAMPPDRGGSGRDSGRWSGDGPPGSRGRRPDFDRLITPEQRDNIIEVVSDLRPLSDEDKQRLRDMDPSEFQMLVLSDAGRILSLARMREYQPKLYGFKIDELLLDRDGRAVASALVEATKAGDESLVAAKRKELSDLVAKQIELQFALRQYEIDLLERRVSLMRLSLEDDERNRQSLIEQRAAEFTRDAEEGRGAWDRGGRNGQGPGGGRPGWRPDGTPSGLSDGDA